MSEEITQHLPDGDLKRILTRLGSMNKRLATLEAIDKRLAALEDKVDRPLQETRPIWEQVLARMDKLETEVTEMRAEMRDNFETLEEKINVLAEDVVTVGLDRNALTRVRV